MIKRKRIREKGKIRLSEYFKVLKEGETVAIVRELAERSNVPKRMQGRTGIVKGRRGNAYIVKINDINQEKEYVVKAVHLKRIKN
ncbi:50S ribosomal protein L21e [Candidatus Pacearchaeota archaeon CG10_big_fil_rev_8_21_14_0_10_35_13]|nr:MAG: 50S ribosomal protein L21e [Candidatus Pacearchaeota archaeon CG10_big_fil_rev_8_21_14_0_10_35_13]